jgi:hypothetical protein
VADAMIKALFLIALPVGGASVRLIEKGFYNQFEIFYIAHGLMHYPWWRRRLYLHYALFLRALTDRPSPVSRETIT